MVYLGWGVLSNYKVLQTLKKSQTFLNVMLYVYLISVISGVEKSVAK